MELKIQYSEDGFSERQPEIISQMLKKCSGKGYFKDLNMNASYVIPLITKDYLECISLYIATNSLETFKEKVSWFISMASSRMPERNLTEDLTDLFLELKNVILGLFLDPDGQLQKAFDDFTQVIKQSSQGVS